MTWAYFGFVLLLGASTVVAFAPHWSPRAKHIALIPAALAFIWAYVWVSTTVAQDRDEYFRWYRSVAFFLENGDTRDIGFSLLLASLPDGLSSTQFGAI